MTEFVGTNLNFGDLLLKEEFDYNGKTWRSYLVVPQEHLEDLFRIPQSMRPTDAYHREKAFWNQISELTRDFYRNYLERYLLRRPFFAFAYENTSALSVVPQNIKH